MRNDWFLHHWDFWKLDKSKLNHTRDLWYDPNEIWCLERRFNPSDRSRWTDGLTWNITDAITIRILKRSRIDLIGNTFFPPFSFQRCCWIERTWIRFFFTRHIRTRWLTFTRVFLINSRRKRKESRRMQSTGLNRELAYGEKKTTGNRYALHFRNLSPKQISYEQKTPTDAGDNVGKSKNNPIECVVNSLCKKFCTSFINKTCDDSIWLPIRSRRIGKIRGDI